MEESKKYNRQLEINDLIDDATNNAVARRGLLETLSDDEAASVGGGRTLLSGTKRPTIAGFKTICPPITVGLMAAPGGAKLIPN